MAIKREVIYDEVHRKDWSGTWLGEIGFWYRKYGDYDTGIEVMVGDREGNALSRWTHLYDGDQTHMHNEFNMEFEVDGKIFPAEYKHFGNMWGYRTNRNDIQEYIAGRDNIRYRVYIYIDVPEPPSSISKITTPKSVIEKENINISWTKADKARIYRLECKVDGKEWMFLDNTKSSNYVVASKTTWDKVEFRIRAENDDGHSSWTYSSPVIVEHPIPTFPPTRPSSITVPKEVYIDSMINVSWGDGTRADIYILERSIDNNKWEVVQRSSAKSFKEKANQEWSNVRYRVRSYNNDGFSTYRTSNIITIIPRTAGMANVTTYINNEKRNVTYGYVMVDNEIRNITKVYTMINNEIKLI